MKTDSLISYGYKPVAPSMKKLEEDVNKVKLMKCDKCESANLIYTPRTKGYIYMAFAVCPICNTEYKI